MQNKIEQSMVLKNKGNAFFSNQQYLKAITCYEKALKLNPNLKEAWYNKGLCLQETKKNHEAIIAFGEAIKLDPLYAKAVYNKALILSYKQPEEALAVINVYVKNEGDNKEILALKEKIAAKITRRTFVDTASPDSTIAMLEMMQRAVIASSNLGKDLSTISQNTLTNISNNAIDSEEIRLFGVQIGALSKELCQVATGAQEGLDVRLNEAVGANTTLDRDSKYYWAVISNNRTTAEHIAKNPNDILLRQYPKKDVNCFDNEEGANEALVKLFKNIKRNALTMGFVFIGNVSCIQFESLFKRDPFGKLPSEVLKGTIEGWKEYQYDRNQNALVLLTEHQEKTEKTPAYKVF